MKSILHHEMKNFVNDTIAIDSHSAKLGKDDDISVLKFQSTDKEVAKDLVSFIESGYKFVLDADHSPSKNDNGHYDIFVEVERNNELPNNIIKLTRDIEQVTGILPWKFSFYKNESTHKLTKENLAQQIPTSPSEYTFLTDETIDEDIDKFFESTGITSVKRNGKQLEIGKKYSKHVFEIKSVNDTKNNGIYKIDYISESQSSYINSWLGQTYRVVKLDDAFKISNDDNTIILKPKDF